MLEYKFDTQMLVEGDNLSEDEINNYIIENFEGDSLLVLGDESTIKLHYHTNTPWQILEYCASLGDIYDVVVENMERQANGLAG
jgi:dihydroxyacetone kinase-like predicted kinase